MTNQKYKIFINGKPVILCENPGQVDEILEYNQPFIIQKYKSDQQLKQLLQTIYEPQNESGVVLFGKDIQLLLEQVLSPFVCIEAAGGVVQNEERKVLLIFRRGSWDLPKGKVETGETLEVTAVREVQEETGLSGRFQVLSKVFYPGWLNEATYHTYEYKSQKAMKISHWYLMNYEGSIEVKPQIEEDIEQVIWVAVNDLKNYYDNMYPSVRDVLNAIFSNR